MNVAAPLTYEYDVRALDAAGNVSEPSNFASATVPDVQKPTPPGNLGAAATASQVDLTWDGSADNVAVTSYRIYRDGVPLETVGAVTRTRIRASRLPATNMWCARFDAAGNLSDPSNIAHRHGARRAEADARPAA